MVSRADMLRLAEEAEVPQSDAGLMIDDICKVADQFADIADSLYPGAITPETLRMIQGRIDQNVALLRQGHTGRDSPRR